MLHQQPSNNKRESVCQCCAQSHFSTIFFAPKCSSDVSIIICIQAQRLTRANTGNGKMCPAYGKGCNKCSNSRVQMWSGSGSRKSGGTPMYTIQEKCHYCRLFFGFCLRWWHWSQRMAHNVEGKRTGYQRRAVHRSSCERDTACRVSTGVCQTCKDNILTAIGNNNIRPEGGVQLYIFCPENSMRMLLSSYVISKPVLPRWGANRALPWTCWEDPPMTPLKTHLPPRRCLLVLLVNSRSDATPRLTPPFHQ